MVDRQTGSGQDSLCRGPRLSAKARCGRTRLRVRESEILTGERVQFATATQWVAQLAEAKRQNTPEAEIKKTSLISLIAVDEIG